MTVTSGIRCVPDMARFWSAKNPDKAALIDTDRVVTYAQLDDRSNRIANTLTAAGIRPGSHVGYLGKNSPVYKVPKEIHLTDALPRTASGKVQKAALRQQLQASPQQRI